MFELFLEDGDLLEEFQIQEFFKSKKKEPKENPVLIKIHKETIKLLKTELSKIDINKKLYNIRNNMNDESVEFDYESFIRNDKRDTSIEVVTFFDVKSTEKTFNNIIKNVNKALTKSNAELKCTIDKTDDAGYVFLSLKNDKKSYIE